MKYSLVVWNNSWRNYEVWFCRIKWNEINPMCRSTFHILKNISCPKGISQIQRIYFVEKSSPMAAFFWCRWWDSNPHDVATNGFWVRHVYHSITPANEKLFVHYNTPRRKMQVSFGPFQQISDFWNESAGRFVDFLWKQPQINSGILRIVCYNSGAWNHTMLLTKVFRDGINMN